MPKLSTIGPKGSAAAGTDRVVLVGGVHLTAQEIANLAPAQAPADGSVTTAKLANGAVTDTKLDAASVAEFIRDTIAAALVAGTNVTIVHDDAANTITVNSTGGGGGAAASAFNFPRAPVVGVETYIGDDQSAALTSLNLLTGRIVYVPFVVPYTITLSQIGLNITSVSAGNAAAAIYSNVRTNGKNAPGSNLVTSATFTTGTVGLQMGAAALTLTAGTMYWYAYALTNSVNGILSSSSNSSNSNLGRLSPTNHNNISALEETVASGSITMPATANPTLKISSRAVLACVFT